MGRRCESCSMPLRKTDDRGTESDGGPAAEYCRHCYVGGRFVESDLDAAAMQRKVVEKMRDMGIPRWLGRLMSRGVPKLKRWRST